MTCTHIRTHTQRVHILKHISTYTPFKMHTYKHFETYIQYKHIKTHTYKHIIAHTREREREKIKIKIVCLTKASFIGSIFTPQGFGIAWLAWFGKASWVYLGTFSLGSRSHCHAPPPRRLIRRWKACLMAAISDRRKNQCMERVKRRWILNCEKVDSFRQATPTSTTICVPVYVFVCVFVYVCVLFVRLCVRVCACVCLSMCVYIFVWLLQETRNVKINNHTGVMRRVVNKWSYEKYNLGNEFHLCRQCALRQRSIVNDNIF